jgi:mono/diheme cytochrome c family protein
VALDGFAAELAAAPLLNTQGAQAWLAIKPDCPWPLSAGKPSAGPFYLVWTDPQAANISPEQWPYQVPASSAWHRWPNASSCLLPDLAWKADDPVNQGFALFQKNCLACHRLNGAGDAQFDRI